MRARRLDDVCRGEGFLIREHPLDLAHEGLDERVHGGVGRAIWSSTMAEVFGSLADGRGLLPARGSQDQWTVRGYADEDKPIMTAVARLSIAGQWPTNSMR